MTRMSVVAAVLALSASASGAEDPRLTVLHAMQAELSRSMEKLRLNEYEPPYFVAYQVKDVLRHEVSGRYGAVFNRGSNRERKVFVDVRVGSYELDSSGAESSDLYDFASTPRFEARREAPLDDDPRALRNALWLVTDERYKAALAAYLQKKSKRVYDVEEKEQGPSFSREKPSRYVQPPEPFAWDNEKAERLVREVSAVFRGFPDLFDSDVRFEASKAVRTFASSEGSGIITERSLFEIHVQGFARAADGQLLENGRDWYASSAEQLPSLEKVRQEALAMSQELLGLRKAPTVDPYTGPAILAPVATGVLFHEVIGHRLEGDRQEDRNDGRTFKGQVGNAVIPPFLGVLDDPTLAMAGGTALNGFYRFDEDGVPAQRVLLIERGVLKNFLLSRRPIKGFAVSNGHGRSQGNHIPTARMGNLIVESKRAVSEAKLKQMLIDEAKRQKKPYALILKDITGGNTNTSSFGYQAFKGQPRLVYRVDVKTGKEELVRGVEMVGTPLTTINKIVATGDKAGVFNGFCGAESGYVPVSTVAPATLISELELQRTAKTHERAPLLPSPWSVDDAAPENAGNSPK